MRITSKGQVTIPLEIREKFGFLPNTDIVFSVKKGEVFLYKNKSDVSRGKSLINLMTGKSSVRMTTDEIMRLTRS